MLLLHNFSASRGPSHSVKLYVLLILVIYLCRYKEYETISRCFIYKYIVCKSIEINIEYYKSHQVTKFARINYGA